MPAEEAVRFDLDERGVATITLNRPEKLNAINMAMRDLIWTYLEAARDLPGLRCVVFQGEGRSFSAGADIAEFGTAPSLMASRRARHDRDVWGLLLTLPVPTIVRMHGMCYGAGLELPLCCDRRVAAFGSRFSLPEVTLGYMPSAGGTQTLPRTVPPGVAAHMILTGEPIEVEDALRWGLVDLAVPPEDLDEAVEATVASVLDGDANEAMQRRLARYAPIATDPAPVSGPWPVPGTI